ncbi:serine/threonine protein kinase [Haliangium ochraceum]|uniref:Serine/threonine protein kinase n=1 Tax=Haliangium ochraceum (strain DSM 14365 / JCM 11303 / SMP-2) TaxID=502025 RepID=D0LGH5_HALO1|nr:serine/threonine protein kinase [Haliangium ochraceum]ACY12721.1 serine/threonine protein kinase [Haliangium ochraceum DSM 14365]
MEPIDLAELEKRLGPGASVDLRAEYERFRHFTDQPDLGHFVAYLSAQGLISGTLERELSDGSTVGDAAAASGFDLLLAEAATAITADTRDTRAADDGSVELRPIASHELDAAELSAAGYDPLGRVGRGAMGDVYAVRDRELQRPVAFKRLNAASAARPNTVARFLNEVQVTAQLDHPNVVPIHSLVINRHGLPAYTMKLVDGRTLSEVLREARKQAQSGGMRGESRRLTQRLEYFLKVCDAMSYAHSKGVLHRDIKPDNVMIGHFSEVYVMDWGVCCSLEQQRQLAQGSGGATAATAADADAEQGSDNGAKTAGNSDGKSDTASSAAPIPQARAGCDGDPAAPAGPGPGTAAGAAWALSVVGDSIDTGTEPLSGKTWQSNVLEEWGDADPSSVSRRSTALSMGSSGERYTRQGAIVGTPAYMSPEQSRGEPLDQRSDVFSLGLLLFELISLRPGLAGGGAEATLLRAAKGKTHPLVHHNPKLAIARELRAIVAKALAPAREDRYPDVDTLAEDVRAYLRGDEVKARPDTLPQALVRWLGRHKLLAMLVMAAVLLASAALVIVVLLQKESALRAARHKEERVQTFLLAVSRHSHAIDSHFATFESGLAELSGRLHELLTRTDAGTPTLYHSDDYKYMDRSPADWSLAPRYNQPVSFDHPVFKLAPGVSAEQVTADMARVRRLAPAMRSFMLESAGLDASALSRSEQRRVLASVGVPAIRSFVGLENGVYMSYPGQGGYPPAFDGRLRPNYRLAAHREGIVWGNPYLDRYGLGVVLSAATGLYDDDGEFVGVVGLDMLFDWLTENLLALPEAPYVELHYLVDAEGEIIIQNENGKAATGLVRGGDTGHDLHGNRAIDLAPLPFAAVREALAQRSAGSVAFREGGRRKLAAFYPIDSLGWSYVVIADVEALLASRASAE